MVFIENPRSETNRGREGGDRIVLRSKHSNLSLRHTCSILTIKVEVGEMGVVRVVIQRILPHRGVHPPVFRPRQPQKEHEGVAVGDGGDGSGRAWVLEVILQVIVGWGRGLHAGRGSLTLGHLKFFSGQYSLGRCGRSPLTGTKGGALRRKDKPLAAI